MSAEWTPGSWTLSLRRCGTASCRLSGPSARSPRSMTASCIWNIRWSSRRPLPTTSWRSWASTAATAASARPSIPSHWSSTTRMSASPPITTCTTWPRRCTPSSMRAAMRCTSWASGTTCSIPAWPAASAWASTRASPAFTRTSSAVPARSLRPSTPGCRRSSRSSWAG